MRISKLIKNTFMILAILTIFNTIFSVSYASVTTDIIGMYKGNVSDTEAGGGIVKSQEIIGRIISIVQVFGVFVAVAMSMILGIKYMYSSPDDRAQIKKHLTVYVVGALVMFGAASILEIIKNFFIDVTT